MNARVKKSTARLKKTAEFFTPMRLVNEMIDKIVESSPDSFADPDKTFLDPTCGNGQFIMGTLKRKVKNSVSKEHAIKTTFGADLMVDNIADLMARIVFWKEFNIDIFDDKGNPVSDLKHDCHDDNHSIYWLHENGIKDYKRTYIFKGITVSIRQHPKKWWLFEHKYKSAKVSKLHYSGGGWNTNYVVADAFKYNYNFDGNCPNLEDIKKVQRKKKAA